VALQFCLAAMNLRGVRKTEPAAAEEAAADQPAVDAKG